MADSGSTALKDAAALVLAWDRDHPSLAAGMTPVRDLVVADELADQLSDWQPWGEGLPPDLNVATDVGALALACSQAGYLVADPWTGDAHWARRLAGCRALIVPSQATLSSEALEPVRQFVRDGGVLIAFGFASLLQPDGGSYPSYRLHDVLGGHYQGRVKFDTDATRVTTTGDSIWAPIYGPEKVIDGRADQFWASEEGAPMPHWVEIGFAAPRTVARADVQCRPGFLLKDFEVQCKVGDEWVTAAQVTGNEDWEIPRPFAEPIEASAVRLWVTREEFNGQDRQIADVGEVVLYDAAGRRLISPPYLIEATITDPAWAEAHRTSRLVLRSPAALLSPERAGTLASFPDPLSGRQLSLCTRNRFGKGPAYHVAVPEACLVGQPEVLEAMLRAFVGAPVVRHSGDENVFAFLSRGEGRYLLHIVDTAPTATADRAKEIIVRVNTGALGPIAEALLVPGEDALPLEARDQWVQFVAPMDPEACVLLRTGQ